MKPLWTWLARLGIFGALAIVAGCGGGAVPDAGSEAAMLPESSAPAQPTPGQAVAAAAPAPAEEAKAEEATAQAQPAAAAAATQEVAATQEPAPAAAATQESPAAAASEGVATTAPAPAAPDNSSATAEMLRISTREQPAPAASGAASAAGPGAAPAAGPGPGGAAGPGGPGPGGGTMAGIMVPGAGQANAQNPANMAQGMQGMMQQQQQQQAAMRNQMQANMRPGGPGGPPGMGGPGGPPGMGGPGGPGMGGNNSKPPDFRTPQGAVQAFLDALKARDLSRLTEATAMHAGIDGETVKRNQDMFKRIFDGSFSDSELGELAAQLEDFKISGMNAAKSTGRQGVILSKRGDKDNNYATTTIVITARRERKGWGVCDISRPAQLKNPRMGPTRSNQKR